MSASRLIDQLEKHGLVSDKVIGQLRKQITPDRDAQSIARFLVRRGLLTREQARRMVEAATSSAPQDEELGMVLLGDDDLLEAPAPAAPERREPDAPAPRPSATPRQPARSPQQLTESDLLDDSLADDAWSEPAHFSPARRANASWWSRLRGRDRRPTNRWDSPLILWGGGALIALVALAIGLGLYLFQGSGDQLLAAADEAYRGQQYQQAIEIYNRFLDGYSSHEGAGHARTRRGLAEIRLVADLEKDWPAALRAAQRVLPRMQEEKALQEAHAELSDLLPRILDGLIDRAARAATPDEAQAGIDQADRAIELLNNPAYLPSSRRQAKEDQIQQLLSRRDAVVRQITRDEKLAATLEQMAQLAGNGEIVQAYQSGYDLVRSYPVLVSNRRLDEAFEAIAPHEKEAIARLDHPPAPRQPPAAGAPSGTSLPAFDVQGEPADDLPDELVIPLLAKGSVYAVRAASGQVLWRRFVGYSTAVDPLRLGQDLVIATNQEDNTVTALELDSGAAIWQLPCPSRPLPPALAGGDLLVSCEQGELLQVDAAGGVVKQAIRFPLPLSTGAAWDSQRGRIYQPAAYASLYQLDARSLECLDILPLGHRQGSLAVAPVVVEGTVLVAENAALGAARLHVLVADDEGHLERAEDSGPLAGQVTSAMQVDGTRVAVVTDRGSVRVIDVRPAGGDARPRTLIDQAGTISQATPHFAYLQQSRLWIAGPGVVAYDLVASQGRLSKSSVYLIDDRVCAPLQSWGSYLFILSQHRNGALRLTAQNASTSRPHWSTRLAGAPAGPLHAIDQGAVWIHSGGSVYHLADRALSAGSTVLASDRSLPNDTGSVGGALIGPEQSLLIYGSLPTQHLWYLNPAATTGARDWKMALEGQPMTAPPAWGPAGLAVPTAQAIHLIDPATGQAVAVPFQPRLGIDEQAGWTAPAWIGDQPEMAVADQQGRLFRLRVESNGGQAHLALKKQTQLPGTPVSPPAASDQCIWIAVEHEGQYQMVVVQVAELSPLGSAPLPAPPAWGPERVGPSVLAADQGERLFNWNLDGTLVWQKELDGGHLAGRPWWDGSHWNCTLTDGRLVGIDAGSGEITDRGNAGEPLASGPVPVDDRLVACLANGGLFAFATVTR